MPDRQEYLMPRFGANPEEIAEFVNRRRWEDWLPVYRPWRRQVEENVRMLSGRQWDTYIESDSRFIDLADWFMSGDDRWRQYPVFNWLVFYYKMTIAKLTENIPTMGITPATADFKDAMLAEVLEPIWRYEWDQMEMPENIFELYGWILTAGRGVMKLRWDVNRGPAEAFTGPAEVMVETPSGPMPLLFQDAPYTQDPASGLFVPNLLGSVDPETGQEFLELDEDGLPQFGPPFVHRLGDFAVDVLNPMSVITPMDDMPFHRKAWYTHEYWIPVEEAETRFGMEIGEEDYDDEDDDLSRMMFASHFGMPNNLAQGRADERVATRGMCRIRESWVRSNAYDPELRYGRLTIVTKTKTLYDDINPYVAPGSQDEDVIPFYSFDLTKLPFRQEGTADLEFLNNVQRATNRRMGALMDAVETNEQPLTIVNEAAVDRDQVDQINKAGGIVWATPAGGMAPIDRLAATDIPRGSVEMLGILQQWMDVLGATNQGAQGKAVTAEASGELQREVRFDADRPHGTTLRRHSYVYARMILDMTRIMSVTMSDERLITISGDDNAAKFLLVRPELFEGRVNVRPNPESSVIESRTDKQNRILALVERAIIPPDVALQSLGYPDLVRLTRPGYEAWSMAERENSEMLMGNLPPALPEHDHLIHIQQHRKFQQTVEYRNLPPPIQNLFRLHLQLHELLLPQQQVKDAMMLAPGMAAQSAAMGAGGAPGSESQPTSESGGGPEPSSASE